MKLELLTPQRWLQLRDRLIAFAALYSDKRLTLASLQSLRSLDCAQLGKEQAEAAIAVLSLKGRIKGIGFASDGGEGGCLIVVHPSERGNGLGTKLAKALLEQSGRLTCNVALDNPASMLVCFHIGMKAVSMHTGPTGKPTLRFERGLFHDTTGAGYTDVVSQ